jgi:hypothetical protein
MTSTIDMLAVASRSQTPISTATHRAIAVERLRQQAIKNMTPKAPSDPEEWIKTVYPHLKLAPSGDRHFQMWEWASTIRRGKRPHPFVAIWPRGSGKSTTAEIITTYLGSAGDRKYAWYVSGTQPLADLHVESIGSLLESPTFAHYYPLMSSRAIGKYGNVKGWRRNRLRTANGFIIDALGIDSGARGSKMDDQRPDLIILDDIDTGTDSDEAIEKKIETITHGILPAGSQDVAILAIQNLISKCGFFGQMVSGKADYLTDRIMSGPFPAVYGLETQLEGGRNIITAGTPSWVGQPLESCQSQIDSWGISAFLKEAQHEIKDEGSLFSSVRFQYRDLKSMPEMVRVVVVVDPAVSKTDNSDAHGIIVGGLGADDRVYFLWSHEEVMTPESSITLAIKKGIEFGADTLIIEANQGDELWRTVYDHVIGENRFNPHAIPQLSLIKAHGGAGSGSKVTRANALLAGYETNRVIHRSGGDLMPLEQGMARFPVSKPFDLVDAAVHCWVALDATASWLLG